MGGGVAGGRVGRSAAAASQVAGVSLEFTGVSPSRPADQVEGSGPPMGLRVMGFGGGLRHPNRGSGDGTMGLCVPVRKVTKTGSRRPSKVAAEMGRDIRVPYRPIYFGCVFGGRLGAALSP